MKKIILDLETDSLDYTKCWVVATHELVTNTKHLFRRPDINEYERERLADHLADANEVIMHNGLGFDWFVLRDLCKVTVLVNTVFDTLVAGRLLAYSLLKNHKLETIGEFFGYPKPVIEDFTQGLTDAMVERVESDVEITRRWYQYLCNIIHNQGGIDSWREALKLEFETQIHLEQFTRDGFYFDTVKAKEIYNQLKARLVELENLFQELWPPELKLVETKSYRVKQDGTEWAHVLAARAEYPKVLVDDDQLMCYSYVSFNPGSPKDRIDKLWDAGWNPTVKTDKHYQWDRLKPSVKKQPKEAERGKKFARYGWKCNEENLLTLPGDAPDGAHRLAEYLTLQGRLADLEEWLACVSPDDSRIHGRFVHIGSWTQRLAHYNPNQANIFAPFHGEANTPVKRIKQEYDEKLRALWCVPEGKVQVGCDAEGIQLRLLAHFMKSELYRDAILLGNKEDKTDIHNVNRQALGLDYVTRDMAKTFIYAFLLGAGVGRVQQILECTMGEAKAAMDSFYHSIPGLHELKNVEIPAVWRRGYFIGLDGRRVKPPSEHKVLAGMLQNGEVVVMKKALTIWRKECIVPHRLLTWPHDEWQTEVDNTDDGHYLGKLQSQSIVQAGEHFNLFCPMAGEYRLGTNWSETH